MKEKQGNIFTVIFKSIVNREGLFLDKNVLIKGTTVNMPCRTYN
jgi:hypothetical protein